MNLPEAEARFRHDPVALVKVLWPDVHLYDRQREILRSVWANDTTVVKAGHMLGKDFMAGLAVLAFFLSRHPCRVVTTSVDHTQLKGVLWGEIRRFIQTCRFPLSSDRGGPLVVNELHLRKMVGGKVDGLSYVIGRVAAKGEGMSGHHVARTGDGIPRTLFVADEASGIDQTTVEKASEWANRTLIIGNPYDCDTAFKWAFKGRPGFDDPGGDLSRPGGGKGLLRKTLTIRADDSPNVRLGLEEKRLGREPSGRIILPGVLSWQEYVKRRATWDRVKACVGLDAEFFEGAENLLFPPEWLNHAARLAEGLRGKPRRALGVGIDPGEGVAQTSMAAVDEHGLIELVSKKTPDTSVIRHEAMAFWKRHGVKPDQVAIDSGGGGKQIADELRAQGHHVVTVAFGEAVVPAPSHGHQSLDGKLEQREERYAYVNRRAQMYGELSLLLDPSAEPLQVPNIPGGAGKGGWAMPAEYAELRRQLAPIPRLYEEGRLRMLPKSRRSGQSKERTLEELLGCSPDEADSVALACHIMLHRRRKARAGAF